MPGKRWTVKEVSLLQRWYCHEGRSREAIAKQLKRTIFAVDNKIERLKLRRQTNKGLARSIPRTPAKNLLRSITRADYLQTPEKFVEFINVELHDYQWDGWELIDNNTRTILCWNRQAGKDMLLSIYGLYLALTQDNAQIICVSPSDRQSKLWMRKVQDFTRSRSQLRNLITDISKSEIGFANGSRLTSLPGGMEQAATIRGFSSVDLLICNEAAYITEDVFHGITPFLAASQDAKIVLISTPFGTLGYFYRMWESDLYAHSLVTADMCPHIKSEFLEAERISMPALKYASEYECQFLSSQTAFFPTELIDRVTETYNLSESIPPEYQEGYKFYLGFDPARVKGGDKSVLTVIAENDDHYGRVLWLKEFEDISYVDQCAYVSYLHGVWKFKQIFVDQSSHAVVDALRVYRLPVTPVSFSLQGKIELYGRLKSAMEGGFITIPSHPNLNQELSTFEYRITESGNMTLHGTGHDDYCDSLALAASELTRPQIPLSATLVDQSALSGEKGVISMDEWKETFMWQEKKRNPLRRITTPGQEVEKCICDSLINGPRALVDGRTYVDANHSDCIKKARLIPRPKSEQGPNPVIN